jgi:hypothetical protein
MKNKTVAQYFESAKKLPVSVSIADVRLMVSTHGIPPKPMKWWNFNNLLIMTTTISIISAIVLMTVSNEAKEIKYNYEPVKIELVSPLDTYSNYFKSKQLIEKEIAQVKTIEIVDTPTKPITNAIISDQSIPVKSPIVQPTLPIQMAVAPVSPIEVNEISEEIEEIEDFEGFELFEMDEDDSIDDRVINIKGESKSVTQKMSAKGIELFQLHNKNGQIDITTWDQPEIEVTAIFTIETKADEDTKKALDDFTFELSTSGKTMEVKTNWDDVQNCNCSSSKKSNKVKTDKGEDIEFKQFTIAYKIKAPKKISYDLKNTYADINMEDVDGQLTVELFKGDLNAGNVSEDINLSVKYGNATLGEYGNGGEVTLFKAALTAKSAQKLKLKSNYSSVNLGKLDELDIVGFKSSFNFSNSIDNLNGSVKYGSLAIVGNVKELDLNGFKSSFAMKDIGNAKLSMSYSSLDAKNGGKVQVENAFKSTINLNTISDLDGSFKYSPLNIKEVINHLSLSTFKGDVSINEVGEGFSTMKIDGKYANINIQFNPKAAYNLNASSTYSSLNVPPAVQEFTVENGHISNFNHFIGNGGSSASTVTVSLFQGNLNIK